MKRRWKQSGLGDIQDLKLSSGAVITSTTGCSIWALMERCKVTIHVNCTLELRATSPPLFLKQPDRYQL
ncbi:hypothetical protein PBY51_011057 [Eleginops maclovinus]|uniref:Uncharacterized protein n=1 Tax=Eleginops maclovinus TaxID=56733 RepID=A0AAN7X939_ELEMC|nr:hypothetical protein PBY51_011057 [Eleginops maclovinus]